MTATTTWSPKTLTSVTLTEAQWSKIRTAVLCLAADCRTTGKDADADYYLKAYRDLVDAMGA